jgi:pimeloyl-ACP methyl ester carboxylesterase
VYLSTANATFHDVSFAGSGSINGNNTFNNLTLGTSKTTSISGTQTINGTFTCNGTCSIPAILSGGTLSKASGSVTINYVRLQNVTATGGAVFTANNVTDFGGNNGWTINTPLSQNLYWVGNGGNWTDAFHWSLTSGGTSSGCIPNPYDNVYFDANSFGGGGQTVTIDQVAYCKSMNWTGAVSSSTLGGGYPLNIYGSFILNSLMNVTFNGVIYFKSNNPGNNIQTFGKTLSSQIYFDGLGGEWTLQDNLTATNNYIYLNTGSFNTNNVTINAFIFNSTGSGIRSLTLGSSTINVSYGGGGGGGWDVSGSNLTISSGTSTIKLTGATYEYFNAANFTYYNVVFDNPAATSALLNTTNATFHDVSFAGSGSINGNNTFNNLTLGTSKTISISGTQTINGTFTCNGTAGILASISGGTISKSSGTVCINYVNLTNSVVTGGAIFYAGNSQNLGTNTGWLFQSCTTNNVITLISPGNSSSPGYTISTLNPLFFWNGTLSASVYGLQLYKKNSIYELVYNADSITATTIVLPAGTISDGAQYYWQVRAKINTVWTSYSLPFYFNVTVASLTPILTLSSKSIQSGGTLSFSGSNFSANKQAKAIINSNNGYDTTITVNCDNIGYFTKTLTLVTPGNYDIYCKDVITGNVSSSKSFEVVGTTASYFSIILPNSGYKANINEPVLVEWKDKLTRGNSYPIVGSQRKYNYYVEGFTNSGGSWQPLDTMSGVDDIDKIKTFSTGVTIAAPSTNYLIRVRDGYAGTRITDNVSIQILTTTPSALSADFIWDYSYPTNIGQPIGVVTDGTSRFYIKVSDPGNPISQVTFSLFDDDNNNETRTLGKLKEALNTKTYDTSANNASQLTLPITKAQGNNEFWSWYVAPDDFIGLNTSISNLTSRDVKVKITAEYSGGSSKEITKKITIKRPPVVLVHGLNDDISVWNYYDKTSSFLKSSYKLSIDGQGSFDKNASSILVPNNHNPAFSIPAVIEDFRKSKIACNQVYYVGHSMGGIVLRYAETYYPNNFVNQKNYQKGYVNKFVSLDTPHKGSPFANILESKILTIAFLDFGLDVFDEGGEIDKFYIRETSSGHIIDVNPAIRDLKMGLFDINSTAYKSHVFIGDMLKGSEDLSSISRDVVEDLDINSIFRGWVSAILFYNPIPIFGTGLKGLLTILDNDYISLSGNSISNSDLIVPLNSQLSDLPQGSSLSTYTVNFHSKAAGNPYITMNSAGDVATLLDTKIMGSEWGSLPALHKTTTNLLAKSLSKNIVKDTSFITVFAPRNLDTLYIDSLFSLTFSISDTSNLKKVVIIYQDKFIEDTIKQTNYNYSLSVSNNLIDTQKVVVLALYSINDSTIVSGKSIPVIIKSSNKPTAIKSKENFVYLLKDENFYPEVNMYFEKFIGKIGTTGTALNVTIANPEILSFNSHTKKMTAIKDGETFAVIEYGGLKDTIYFKINGDNITDVNEGGNNSANSSLPDKYELFQNYPNPY